jgi:electron transport complex protein RnfE
MPRKKPALAYEFAKGIIKENPVLVTLLGMCPTLAVTTMAYSGLGMGLATTSVLICSNIAVSLLKNVIPGAVRLPCFIVIIATFATVMEFLLKGYLPALYESLGIFLPLIAVNCIIFARAELFAAKNNVARSALDGAGMGLGFTLALFLMGSLREILGAGTWMSGTPLYVYFGGSPMSLFIMPAGGFFVLGLIIAVINRATDKKPPRAIGCANCPRAATCPTFNKNLPVDESQLTVSIYPHASD